MKAKKGNALAQELMDDLLDEDSKEIPQSKKQSQERDAITVEAVQGTGSSENKTIKISESILTPGNKTKSSLDFDSRSNSKSNKSSGFQQKIMNIKNQFSGKSGMGSPQSITEMSLAQSENLRIAQQKIIDLENEIEKLREQNESLAAAGETLGRRAEELLAKSEGLENKLNASKSQYAEEKDILMASLQSKEKAMQDTQHKVEELEMRLSTNIKKIRTRERELENRLELVKLESSALMRNKDEIILELKRQLDQLNMELDNYRVKGQELNKKLDSKQEVLKRTVKALRIALVMLEGGGDVQQYKKKAD